ncbi:cytochrome p450 [Nannochloropsis oceanica]
MLWMSAVDMGSPVFITVGVALVTTLLLVHMRRHAQTTQPLPPSYRGWVPFLGVGLAFLKNVNDFLIKMHTKHLNDSPFRIYVAGKWWSLVYALPDVKLVLNSKESDLSFLEGFADLMQDMLPKGFTFIPRHHFFLPLFRDANMQWFCNLLAAEAKTQIPLLFHAPSSSSSSSYSSSPSSPSAPPGLIDLFDTCRHLVMRLNLRVLFGPHILKDGRYGQFYECFDVIDPEKGLVDMMSSLLLGPRKKEQAWVKIRGLTEEALVLYRKAKEERGREGEVGEKEERAESVLDLLVRQEVGGLDLEELVADMFAFVFAAFTNSFAVLAWCIWELAGNEEVRSRFVAECTTSSSGSCSSSSSSSRYRDDSVEKLEQQKMRQVRSDSNKKTSKCKADDHHLSNIENMRVGKAVIDEVIRLHSPGLFFRKVVNPHGLLLSTGHHVPAGDFLAFSARHINTLSSFYHSPLDFDIDRFLVRDEKKKAGIFALQWGGGRHPCLGARFAALEILLVLREVFGEEGKGEGKGMRLWRVTEEVEVSKGQVGTSDKPVHPVYVGVLLKGEEEVRE